MEESKGKIGIREFIAILLLTIGPKYGDDTPAILFNLMGHAAWMSPIIIGVIAGIPLFFLYKVLSAYENKNLSDVINLLFGKAFGCIILFLLWLFGLGAILFDTAIYTNIISTMYFKKTPTIVIYAAMMVVCAYGAKKGLEQIGSVAWATLYWIKASLIAVLIIIFVQGIPSFLFPLFGPGEWKVLKESASLTSLYSDLMFITLIFSYIRNKRDYKKGTAIAMTIIITEHVFALIGYVMIFDYIGVKEINFPFHEAIRYIELGFMVNVETFFFPLWVIASFTRFSIYLYLLAILFGAIFRIKEFEYVIPILATFIVFVGMIPENPTFTIFYLREKLLHLLTPVFIFFPIVLWVMAKIKGVFNNEKTDTSSG